MKVGESRVGTWDKRKTLFPPMSEKKNFPNPLVFLGFPNHPEFFSSSCGET